MIVLFESNRFPNQLIGQNDINKNFIQLSKDGEVRSISHGSWLAIIKKEDPQPIVGTLCGKIDENICIRDSKTQQENQIAIIDIHYFYHGEARRIGHYTLKGAQNGLFAALAYGVFWGGMFSIDYGFDEAFGIAALGVGCGSIVFIPPGALLGYLKGLAKDNKAIKYIISHEKGWKIL